MGSARIPSFYERGTGTSEESYAGEESGFMPLGECLGLQLGHLAIWRFWDQEAFRQILQVKLGDLLINRPVLHYLTNERGDDDTAISLTMSKDSTAEASGPYTTLNVFSYDSPDGIFLPVRALLDTGSARNLVRLGTANDLRHPISPLRRHEKKALKDASGNLIRPIGKITARWFKHGATRKTTFYVVPDALGIDVILGCTFLEREGIITFHERLLPIGGPRQDWREEQKKAEARDAKARAELEERNRKRLEKMEREREHRQAGRKGSTRPRR